MLIQKLTAASDGKFNISQGIGFLVVPYDEGATFPIEAHVDGNASASDLLDEERVVRRAAFSKVEFWGAPAGSVWLVYTLQTSADLVGDLPFNGKLQRVGRLVVPETTVLGAGRYYPTVANTYSDTVRLFDVRRFRGVKAICTAESFIDVSGTIKLAMDLWPSPQETPASPDNVIAGSVADFGGAGGVTASIHLGETAGDSNGDYSTSRRDRWPAVSVYLTVQGGSVKNNGQLQVDLWGIP